MSYAAVEPSGWEASLPAAFFARSTPEVARELLGKTLITRIDGALTGGRIVEAEGYLGSDDPGSHAATRGITKRNRVMYGPPGSVYVYFTYGHHYMLNLVTEPEGVAGAVLIRAIEPLFGAETMRERRCGHSPKMPASGPGCLTQALGVDLSLNGVLLGECIDVLDAPRIPDKCVAITGRIGLREGCDIPLRFYVVGSPHVSKGRPTSRVTL